MAVALPLAAGAFSISAGVGAGLATLTGFLQAAGGALTVLGALTKKKDLLKVGAVMSLGGAGLNALGAGAEAASTGVAEAGMQGANEVAKAGPLEGLSSMGEAAAPDLSLSSAASPAGDTLNMGDALTAGSELQRPSLMQTAMQRPPTFDMQQAMDPLQEVGSRYTADSLNQTLKTGQNKVNQMFGGLGDKVDAVGSHLQKNRYLYQMGGSALESMLGPEAERMDWEKSLLARRLKNLNSPVQMSLRSRGG